MKKYLLIMLSFLGLFFFTFNAKVSAISDTKDGVTISFGDGDVLRMHYRDSNIFKVKEKQFYYDAHKYEFDDSYTNVSEVIDNGGVITKNVITTITNNTFTIGDESFTLSDDKSKVTSSSYHERYALSVNVEFASTNEKTYKFTQRLNYKYGSTIASNEDEDDFEDDLNSSRSYIFYYDFLPFYDADLRFDYLEYEFKLIETNNTIHTFNLLRFEDSDIEYKDYFVAGIYYANQYVINYGGKNYLSPVSVSNGTLVTYFYVESNYENGNENRNTSYDINFYVCVGDTYSECESVASGNISTSYVVSYSSIYLTNIEYDGRLTNYSSFLMKASYVCSSGCDDGKAQNTLVYTNEEIYYFNLMTPSFDGTIGGERIVCGSYYCFGDNKAITNVISFYDDNGIESIAYKISSSEEVLLEDDIVNGEELTLNYDEGFYYLSLVVKDGTGKNYSFNYTFIFDKIGPVLETSNFNDYDSDASYNAINIKVTFSDNRFREGAEKIYYLVVKESEVATLTNQIILDANNEYESSGVNIEDSISSDGVYRVCFVGKDHLDNYGAYYCSNAYYLDITALTKEEVILDITESSAYTTSLIIDINVSVLDEGETFNCAIIKKTIIEVQISDLTSTCINKQENTFTVFDENEYSLWIYASDKANNFALLNLNTSYKIDSLAPRMAYSIDGNNEEYGNDVTIDFAFTDVSGVDLTNLEYQFYLLTYDDNDFKSFNMSEGINYPLDYYGEYHLIVKYCDVLANCTSGVLDATFKIDTGIISLSLIGEEKMTILKFQKYIELGASATKGNEGRSVVHLDYEVEGNVDTSKSGTYYLTYSAGSGMNKVVVTREVVVKNSDWYLLAFATLFVLSGAIIALRLFVNKKKNDKI